MTTQRSMILATVFVAATFIAADTSISKNERASDAVPGEQEGLALENDTDRLSYALGMNAAISYISESVEVSPAVFMRGMNDVFSGNEPRLTETERRAIMDEFQSLMLKRRQAQRADRARVLAERNTPKRDALAGEPEGDGEVPPHHLDEGIEPSPEQKVGNDASAGEPALKGLQVAFKMDPRLTKGLYLGDRWISPSRYIKVGETTECRVETRAHGVDSMGKVVTTIQPKWIPEDPEMVTVSPTEGDTVIITVKGLGRSRVDVSASGFTTTLAITAIRHGDVLQVEITQGVGRRPSTSL